MRVTNPYYKTPEQILAEDIAPRVKTVLEGDVNKRQYSLAQIKAALPADAANINREIMFLIASILGLEIDVDN